MNTQTSEIGSDLFVMPQDTATNCSISLPVGFLTDVAFNEGDAMMLDVSVQGASDGSNSILTLYSSIMKSIKLNTGREIKIKEMSVDDIDFCSDIPEMKYDGDNLVAIKYLSKARTAWIRKGVEGADDNFIKTLSDDEKNELSVAVQDYQRLGE